VMNGAIAAGHAADARPCQAERGSKLYIAARASLRNARKRDGLGQFHRPMEQMRSYCCAQPLRI
jgi:hypothetical protein